MSTTNNPGAGTPYALEIRTEALKLISVAPSSRHGEADQLVLGHGDGVKRDIVARARTAHIGGNLSESSDSRATMAKRILDHCRRPSFDARPRGYHAARWCHGRRPTLPEAFWRRA